MSIGVRDVDDSAGRARLVGVTDLEQVRARALARPLTASRQRRLADRAVRSALHRARRVGGGAPAGRRRRRVRRARPRGRLRALGAARPAGVTDAWQWW